VRVEQSLDLLEGLPVDQRLVLARVVDAAVADDAGGEFPRYDVLGEREDVGQAEVEGVGDAAELVRSRGWEGALLDADDGGVVDAGLASQVSE
jgi:hypothetical protein